MTRISNSPILTSAVSSPGRAARMVVSIVIAVSLAACAAAPSKPVATDAGDSVQSGTSLRVAAEMYNTGDHAGALYAFEAIGRDKTASANDRRLAHLGNALVYLGSDPKLHSVPNAKIALVSAGEVTPGANEEFSIETNMLMEAVSFVIGTESKYEVMKEKTGGSSVQVARLKNENAALQSERDTLLAEQKSLKEALEKLKNLTLGN